MKDKIRLIVFLGNKGKQYEKTRHNVAWRIADDRPRSWQGKFNGLWCKEGIGADQLILLKPQTMMNLSGDSVRKAVDFFKLKPDEILVVHDELELPFGDVQARFGGGLAGHNGLRSIKQQLGTADFHRLRVGIGRPPHGDVSRWVLSPFSPSEEGEMEDVIAKAERELFS